MNRLILLAILVLVGPRLHAYSDERAGFTLTVNGEINPYRIFSTFVMPGTELKISGSEPVMLQSTVITVSSSGYQKSWRVFAPVKPGAYAVRATTEAGKAIVLNVLVLTPLNVPGEYLKGYHIGTYPTKPLNGNPIYNKPKGLFEVTRQNEDLMLTPHFSLKQFLCKQAGDYPKFLIVRERLLLKLEYILEKVNAQGYSIETFGFISGYRTPFYNQSIKNAQYSRHVYGGASDIIIDQNGDGSMDDLNKDGVIDEKDVRIFYNIVEAEYNNDSYARFVGGLGFYHKNARHNGFIHVDVRGSRARW